MKNVIRALALILIIITLLAALSMNVFAADSNVEYEGNSGNIIFTPGSNYSPTDLFDGFKKVMPGASLTQKITVKNNADDKVKVRIYLRSLGADDESKEFLNKLKLTVSKVGETPMFDAAAGETSLLTNWTELGLLYSGGEVDLVLTLSVPTELDDSYQKQTGKIKWQFMVVELPADDELWVCPNCKKSDYHIVEDEDGYCIYHCDKCGHEEYMLCEICGEKMRRVVYKDEKNKVWFYYECCANGAHHTTPKTGDSFEIWIWIAVMVLSAIGVFLLIFFSKRKKRKNSEAK